MVLLIVTILVLCVLAIAIVAVRSAHRQASCYPNGLVGQIAVAEETFSREGSVVVRGELWRATVIRGIAQKGERLRILESRPGLLLVVEKIAGESN